MTGQVAAQGYVDVTGEVGAPADGEDDGDTRHGAGEATSGPHPRVRHIQHVGLTAAHGPT